MPVCFCAIGWQHSTFNRLFGCDFLVWRHQLRKVNKSSVRAFRRFFSAIFLSLMFLNIQREWIILKTYDQQFPLTSKKSLHIIFKAVSRQDTCLETPSLTQTHWMWWRTDRRVSTLCLTQLICKLLHFFFESGLCSFKCCRPLCVDLAVAELLLQVW